MDPLSIPELSLNHLGQLQKKSENKVSPLFRAPWWVGWSDFRTNNLEPKFHEILLLMSLGDAEFLGEFQNPKIKFHNFFGPRGGGGARFPPKKLRKEKLS